MERWQLFFVFLFFAWAVLDIRERLPRAKTHKEMSYIPFCEEGFYMKCEELIDGQFNVGFDGEWSAGRFFDVVGEVEPYHGEDREGRILNFEGRQSVRFHPTIERFQRTRIGNVLPSKSGNIAVHIFLPFEVHQQLRNELRENIGQVLEIDVAENAKLSKEKPTTYGVYRFELRDWL